MKQAPEAKKHMKGSVSEAQIRKVAEHYNLTESEVKRRLTLIREFDEGAFKKKLKQLAYSAVKKGFQALLRYICEHGFEHHTAMSLSRTASAINEAFGKYLGWDVYHHA